MDRSWAARPVTVACAWHAPPTTRACASAGCGENLKKNTKVVVWDDDGRTLPYPDDDLEVYYNPDGGTSYHATATCRSVRDKYLPLTAFTYGELDSGKYASLTGCTNCIPVKRRAEIDEINQERIDLGRAA